MEVGDARHKLYRMLVERLVSKEFQIARDWNEEEINDIANLMAERFDDRATTLFYRNGGIILGFYFLLDHFIKNIPPEIVGIAFITYGAILAGYSINGPYRIAIEGLEGDERYELLKQEMAHNSMLVAMGAIYFVVGSHLQIFLLIW